jgi:4-hydroxybenzoate polyprenyltransferase
MAISRWWTYLKERSPLPALLLIAANLSWAASFVSGQTFGWVRFGLGVGGLVLFFILIRLMDEYKDYQKDLVAHPERPIARGLIPTEEARRMILVLTALMLAFSLLLWRGVGWQPAVLYGGVTLYLWLMYREFYARDLSASPFLYALTHQAIVIPLYLFPVALWDPASGFTLLPLCFALANLGGSMSYEVCRKLDPRALPLLRHYVTVYGIHRCTAFLFPFLLLGTLAAGRAGYGPLLGAINLTLGGFLLLLPQFPRLARGAEGLAALASLVATAGPTLYHFLGWGF